MIGRAEIDRYREDGFVVVRDALPPGDEAELRSVSGGVMGKRR